MRQPVYVYMSIECQYQSAFVQMNYQWLIVKEASDSSQHLYGIIIDTTRAVVS